MIDVQNLLFDCITKNIFSQIFTKIKKRCMIVISKFFLMKNFKLLHNLILGIKKSIFLRVYTLYIYEVQMNKESDKNMKLVISNSSEIDNKTDLRESVETDYQSDPIKIDLYSKMLAFHKSQRKFSIKDLIKDNLK